MKKDNVIITFAAIGTAFLVLYGGKKISSVKIDDLEKAINFITDGKYMDIKNNLILEKLHPKYRPLVNLLMIRAKNELGLISTLTSGLRDFAEQAELHKLNPKNARPGYSSHNFGFAVDLNVTDPKTGKTLKKASPQADWIKSGLIKIAKEIGLKWGGDQFKEYYDPVHFYINPNGLDTAKLLAIHNQGKVDNNGYVIV